MLATSFATRPCARSAVPLRSVRTFAKPEEQSAQSNVENVKDFIQEKGKDIQNAMDRTAGGSFAQDARESLKPRVDELRNDQLRKGTTNREEIMSFTGPLPELVNGRLAMLGFTACMAAEYFSHQGLLQQIKTSPLAIAATFAIFIFASLVPIVRGTDLFPPEEKEGGLKSGFTVTNELINGRAAMLGFAIILAYETIIGHPLFV